MDREQTFDLALDIRRRIIDGAIEIRWPSSEMLSSSGDRRSKRRGPGDDHDSMKEYEPGDDLRHVDWIATASSGDPDVLIIKTFYEPKVLRFNVLLDVNQSMNFGTKGTLKSRLAALCAACGIYSAARMKDRVSYATFAAEPVTIRKSQGAARILTDFLVHAIEDGASAPGSEIAEGGGLAASYNALATNSRSLMLVVSDFAGMTEEDWDALRISGFKNDTVAVFVQDLRERELPETPWPGASYTLEDYRGKKQTFWVQAENSPSWLKWAANLSASLAALFGARVSTRKDYREKFLAHEQEVLSRLESYGISTVVVSTEDEENGVRSLLRVLSDKAR